MTLDEIIETLSDIKKYADKRGWTELLRKLADFVEHDLDDMYFSLVEMQEQSIKGEREYEFSN